MKTFFKIDLNECPIVVLGCGHFFTAETLDGHMAMAEVYVQDQVGDFTGLQDTSVRLAGSVPRCPDCQSPVRQYCTQRYNRVVNRAVNDEMTKRFLVSGQEGLRELVARISELEQELDKSREEILQAVRQGAAHPTGVLSPPKVEQINKQLSERHANSRKFAKEIVFFRQKVADKNQPAQKLHDAVVSATRRLPVEEMMARLEVNQAVPLVTRDQRVTLGARLLQLQAYCSIYTDNYEIARALKSSPASSGIRNRGHEPEKTAKTFFEDCDVLIDDCRKESLPKFIVETIIHYAKVARGYESYCRSEDAGAKEALEHTQAARALLVEAEHLCEQRFQNADNLRTAVGEWLKLLGKEWYEEVTEEELAAVKAAMVSGPRGIATHSGHWYNCANGHPFAIGECGMPMQLARCPECGAPVGGEHHQAVEGVSRATDMER